MSVFGSPTQGALGKAQLQTLFCIKILIYKLYLAVRPGEGLPNGTAPN